MSRLRAACLNVDEISPQSNLNQHIPSSRIMSLLSQDAETRIGTASDLKLSDTSGRRHPRFEESLLKTTALV